MEHLTTLTRNDMTHGNPYAEPMQYDFLLLSLLLVNTDQMNS